MASVDVVSPRRGRKGAVSFNELSSGSVKELD